MMIFLSSSFHFLRVVLACWLIISPLVVFADSAENAINRIKSGQHSTMPPPTEAPAHGAEGKGMTIENGTGYVLMIYFNGPVKRTVEVPSHQSVGVDLVVGRYEVAAEARSSNIVPFYGVQDYKRNAHYWLKFYLR